MMKGLRYMLRTLSGICLLLVGLGGCGSDQVQNSDQSDQVKDNNSEVAPVKTPPRTSVTMHWMKNNCWLSASIQPIAKFFPDIFNNSDDAFAKAVKAILPRLRTDEGGITREETERIYEAFWEVFPNFNGRKKGEFNSIAFPRIMRKYKSPQFKVTDLKVLCSKYDKDSDKITFKSKPSPLFKESFIETLCQIPVATPNMVLVLSNPILVICNDSSDIVEQFNAFEEPLFQIDLTAEKRLKNKNMAFSYELVSFITRQSRNAHFVAYTKLDGTWRRYNELEGTTGPISEADALKAATESVYYFYKVLP